MKYLFKLAIITLALLSSTLQYSFTNTTQFWNDEVGSKLYFESYSGYEDIDWYYPKGSASMYYSFWQGFRLPLEDKSIPLIIWLQGGPGAASQFGCFNEVGPVFIDGKKGNFDPIENPWSWNSFGHLMCIDQPVGVGFSYNNNTKKVDNTRDAANHFVNFLANFFANNPKLGLQNNPLYLAGESYAGHWIPAFAEKIKTNTYLHHYQDLLTSTCKA